MEEEVKKISLEEAIKKSLKVLAEEKQKEHGERVEYRKKMNGYNARSG